MSWGQQLMDYMVNPGESSANYCKAASLGAWDFSTGTDVPESAVPWACTTQAEGADTGVDTDPAWALLYAAPQSRQIMQDDGTEKGVLITEFATHVKACKHDLKAQGPFPGGIWVGGVKHSMTDRRVETLGSMSFVCVQATGKEEKGFQLVCTDDKCAGKACIIVAHYDKKKGYTPEMARVVALDFGKWLREQGTDTSW